MQFSNGCRQDLDAFGAQSQQRAAVAQLAEIALELHSVDFYAASLFLDLHQRGLVKVAASPEEIPFEQQVEELRDRVGLLPPVVAARSHLVEVVATSIGDQDD